MDIVHYCSMMYIARQTLNHTFIIRVVKLKTGQNINIQNLTNILGIHDTKLITTNNK